MRRRVAAPDFRIQVFDLRSRCRVFRRRAYKRDVVRHALLQQELRSLDDRLGMKARAHLTVIQRVGNANDGHSLMMGHVGAHDRKSRAFRKPCAGEIDRLVPAVGTERPQTSHSVVVFHDCGRRDHGCQSARIGRNDDAFYESTFVAEIGYAKAGILIGLLDVTRVVFGFRHAPRHVQPVAILLLPAND